MKTYTDLSQALKEPDKVEFLDLSNQELTEIPVEVFQLTNLSLLGLAGNQILVIPPEIGQLTNLIELPVSKPEVVLFSGPEKHRLR